METTRIIITVALGILLLVFGYRIKKITFFILWFLIGHYIMTTYLMGLLNSWVPQIAGDALWQNLLPIAGGLLLALFGLTIEKLCVAGIVLGVTMMITTQYFGTDTQTLLIGLVVGVILAGIAVAMMKPAIIVVTSAAGAYLLTIALITYVTAINLHQFYFPILIGLTVVGSLIQFSNSKHIA